MLAGAVYELVVSLGMKAHYLERSTEWDGVPGGTSYRVSFTPTQPVFRLARKAWWVRFDVCHPLRRHHRMIVDAEAIEPRLMRCIAVDSPHRMYLCGRQMVPTHNTRTGAEWVRSLAESGQVGRIALVAPTAADARDVMVEGESGLLAICPPWDRPHYEPSKRRLTWPSGVIATTYSADEPERLRGPQHAAAWVDELACLVAGTLVQTTNGPKPIESMQAGEMVWTRIGPCRVLHSWQSRPAAQVYRVTFSD
jgi:hypothetical protein